MRAAVSIYEHPQLSDSDVWSKNGSSTRTCVYSVIGVISLAAASTLAVYRYTSLGKSIQESTLGQQWL